MRGGHRTRRVEDPGARPSSARPVDAGLRQQPADAATLRRRVDGQHAHPRLVGALELGERPEVSDERDAADHTACSVHGDDHLSGLGAPGDVAQLGLVSLTRRVAGDPPIRRRQ